MPPWLVPFALTLGLSIPSHLAVQPAQRTVMTVCVTDTAWCNPPPEPVTPDWARCPQWWDTARAIGWPDEQMATLDYVMHRESRCDPHAYNRSGAKGLTQLLGWSCPPDGCFDPTSNLAKALELWRSSGWRSWCLRGDRVTGDC